MADDLAHATPEDAQLLAEAAGEAAAEHYAAGDLTLRINAAADDETLRHIWRDTRDLPENERRVCRDFVVIKHDMLREAS